MSKPKVRRKRKRKGQQPQPSTLGILIDMPMEKFKEELVRQKVNIGIVNNLILILTGSYNELRIRKEAVLDLVFTGKKTKEEVNKALEGLYAEMTKLEQKIVYLKERSKELLDLGDTTS